MEETGSGWCGLVVYSVSKMKALLFVKGMKEPIELEEQEAKAAQRLLSLSSQPNNTPFSIEGVWTGTKGEMKYVMFPRGEKVNAYRERPSAMTKEQAEKFEKEIWQDKRKAFKVFGATKLLRSGEYLSMLFKWPEFFYERRGAIRLEILTTGFSSKHLKWYMKDADLLGKLEDEVESYWAYTRKRDALNSARDKQWDKMAEEMGHLTANMRI